MSDKTPQRAGVDMTEAEFDTKYKPVEDSEGDIQLDWTVAEDWVKIQQAEKDNLLWTAIEDDNGYWCLSSGYHHINRLYYILATVPYEDTACLVVQDYYEFPCSQCSNYEDLPTKETLCGMGYCPDCIEEHTLECEECKKATNKKDEQSIPTH